MAEAESTCEPTRPLSQRRFAECPTDAPVTASTMHIPSEYVSDRKEGRCRLTAHSGAAQRTVPTGSLSRSQTYSEICQLGNFIGICHNVVSLGEQCCSRAEIEAPTPLRASFAKPQIFRGTSPGLKAQQHCRSQLPQRRRSTDVGGGRPHNT